MDLTSSLLAYDDVLADAKREGREPNTADKLLAMKAAIEAYEADKGNVIPPPVRITNLGNSSVYVHVGAKGLATAASQEVKPGQTITAGAAREGGDTNPQEPVNG